MAIDWSPLVAKSAARNDAAQTAAYNLGETLGEHGGELWDFGKKHGGKLWDFGKKLPGGLFNLLLPEGGKKFRDDKGFFQGGSSYDPETGEGGKLFGRAREYMSPENIKARMTDQEGWFQGGFDSGEPRDRMFGRLRDAGEGIYGIGKNIVGGTIKDIAGMPGQFAQGLKDAKFARQVTKQGLEDNPWLNETDDEFWGEDTTYEGDTSTYEGETFENTNLDPTQTSMENTNLDPSQTSMQTQKERKSLLDYLFPNQGQFYKNLLPTEGRDAPQIMPMPERFRNYLPSGAVIPDIYKSVEHQNAIMNNPSLMFGSGDMSEGAEPWLEYGMTKEEYEKILQGLEEDYEFGMPWETNQLSKYITG